MECTILLTATRNRVTGVTRTQRVNSPKELTLPVPVILIRCPQERPDLILRLSRIQDVSGNSNTEWNHEPLKFKNQAKSKKSGPILHFILKETDGRLSKSPDVHSKSQTALGFWMSSQGHVLFYLKSGLGKLPVAFAWWQIQRLDYFFLTENNQLICRHIHIPFHDGCQKKPRKTWKRAKHRLLGELTSVCLQAVSWCLSAILLSAVGN